jgi:hypothetical protein
MRKTLLIPAFVAALTAGCLQKESTQTWYLSPDGGVTWTADELNVRSDAKDPIARDQEERDYLQAIQADNHDVAAALRLLDARTVRTRVLRSERPFHVTTDARFTSVQTLIAKMLDELHVPGDATVMNEGSQTTLRVRINVAQGTSNDDDSALDAFGADSKTFRIVLTSGAFVDAKGFTLLNGNTEARLDERTGGASVQNGVIELMLAWER